MHATATVGGSAVASAALPRVSESAIVRAVSEGQRDDRERREEPEGRVLSVHFGRSANCSSIGSVVDFLFLSGTVGAALLSALVILLRQRGAAELGSGDEGARPGEGT